MRTLICRRRAFYGGNLQPLHSEIPLLIQLKGQRLAAARTKSQVNVTLAANCDTKIPGFSRSQAVVGGQQVHRSLACF